MENVFFLRFLISSLVVSSLTLLTVGIKKLFHKHISPKWQYNIWFIFLVMLVIPFIPQKLTSFKDKNRWVWQGMQEGGDKLSSIASLSSIQESLLSSEKGVQDFALSVDHSFWIYFSVIGITIWMIGMVMGIFMTIRSTNHLRRIKQSFETVQDDRVQILFEACKKELKISKDRLILCQSTLIQGPMAFGLRKTYIILPKKNMSALSYEDIKYILLHELIHYKNKDILMNYIMCFLQIVYWFNPFVHLGFKMMRMDREIACDMDVLKLLDEKSYFNYGSTIINFAEITSSINNLNIITSMGGTKKQIKKRIEKIAYFKKETVLIKFKSIIIFILIGGVIWSQVPYLSVIAYEKRNYEFDETNVVYEDLSSYFEEVEGSFVLYNINGDQFRIYNQEKSVKRVSPNSTYKIYSALMGLDKGIITPEHSVLNWDGNRTKYAEWNRNHDLDSAMKHSVNWYFKDIDKAIGKNQIQDYFEQINYGNSNIQGGVENYWAESSLRISPVEQVNVLTQLYNNELGFKKEHTESVKETLKLSEKKDAILSGKTGTGVIQEKSVSGWFIGYVEQEDETYIFATHIEGEDQINGSLAREITLNILADKNIYWE